MHHGDSTVQELLGQWRPLGLAQRGAIAIIGENTIALTTAGAVGGMHTRSSPFAETFSRSAPFARVVV